MEIAKNKTTLTKKMLFAFQNKEIFKRSWVIIICALALIVVSFRVVDGKLVLNSIPFLVIGSLAYPLYIGILELVFIKQNKAFVPVTIEYSFQTDSIKLDGTSAYGRETSELFYSKLEKIVFTKKYIYLYINKTSALLVDNSSFSSGSVEKIRALLEYSYADKVKGFKRKEKKAEEVKVEESKTETPEKEIKIEEIKDQASEPLIQEKESDDKSKN